MTKLIAVFCKSANASKSVAYGDNVFLQVKQRNFMQVKT